MSRFRFNSITCFHAIGTTLASFSQLATTSNLLYLSYILTLLVPPQPRSIPLGVRHKVVEWALNLALDLINFPLRFTRQLICLAFCLAGHF